MDREVPIQSTRSRRHARRDTAAPQHAPHLGQGADRVAQVLQELVRMHDVERSVWEWQRVHVADT
jgi:hypothetical protein